MPKKRFKYIFYKLILYVTVFIFVAPTLWVALSAIRPDIEINAKPPVWIPHNITFDKLLSLFGAIHQESSVPFNSYLINSITTSVLSSIVAVAVGTLSGYAFARFKFRGKKRLFISLIFVRTIPGIALSLPLFIIFARFKLIDKTFGLALVYIALSIPFVTWLMIGYFKDIPKEIEDSAYTDGCSKWQSFLRIDIPLAFPGLGACWIFVFLTCWNEFPIASILTRTTASKTFPVGLFDFTSEFAIDWRGMAAMSTIMLIPPIVFVLAAQKSLVRGLTFGAVKG